MKISLTLLILIGMAAPAFAADPSPVTINLGGRHAHVTPVRQGFTHTGGGNIDVVQPSPDTLIVTMSGVAVAGAHPFKQSMATMLFNLDQCFEIAIEKNGPRRAKLSLEGRVVGLLRSHAKGGGYAQEGPGQAKLSCGPHEFGTLELPPHTVACGENLSLNCRTGPSAWYVGAGQYTLQQSWSVSAAHPASFAPCKAVSAEFAPDPALDPLWISHWEPFHGATKKDFGFQVILRVTPDNGAAANGQ